VSFIYALIDRSSDIPYHDTCCAGEVCLSRSMEEVFLYNGVDDGGRSGSFSGQSSL
jgi:hypothetical protein